MNFLYVQKTLNYEYLIIKLICFVETNFENIYTFPVNKFSSLRERK